MDTITLQQLETALRARMLYVHSSRQRFPHTPEEIHRAKQREEILMDLAEVVHSVLVTKLNETPPIHP